MAKVSIARLELLARIEQGKDIIDDLQRRGVAQIIEYESSELVEQLPTDSTVAQLDRLIQTARQAREVLDRYHPLKRGMTASLHPRPEMAWQDVSEKSREMDQILSRCHDINGWAKTVSEQNAQITRLETMQDMIRPWLTLDIPMQYQGSEHTRAFIGTLPEAYTEDRLLSVLAEQAPEAQRLAIELVSSRAEQTCAVILCHVREAQQVEEALRAIGFTQPSDPTRHPPAHRMQRLEKEILECRDAIRLAEKQLKSFEAFQEQIDFLTDCLTLRRDKYSALQKMGVTRHVFALSAYVPRPEADALIQDLENHYQAACRLTEPEEDEDVPVLLKNNWFSRPVQGITEMYSLPGKGDIDPNGIMSFFYYFFFGFMLGDAGYGLLMVLALGFAIWKFKPEGRMRNNMMMYLYCGISSIFWGLMYGSFFGDLINVIRTSFLGLEEIRLYLWMDPIERLMDMLIWCFIFGLVHLFVGIAVKTYMLIKEGKIIDALCDSIPIYLTVGGTAPLLAAMLTEVPSGVTNACQYIAITGVILFLLTAGRKSKSIFGKAGSSLYALYNLASGYLGDILSYSRLLALNLAAAVICQVVNLMGALPQNMVFKTILFIVVFLIGHSINAAISLIGAYVHTCRLQYVEFFSRFYEGGGTAFAPLKANTKTFRFKEEIKHG